jgi:hypothetical protein
MESKPGSSFLFEHDLFRKPVSTFRDRAPRRLPFAKAFERGTAGYRAIKRQRAEIAFADERRVE